jgi:predicted transcriptional regulator
MMAASAAVGWLALPTVERYPPTMARVLHWNGRNVPTELRKLPAGEFVIAEYHPRKLTAGEEQGIRRGLKSIAAGRTVSAAKVRAEVDGILAAKRKKPRRR